MFRAYKIPPRWAEPMGAMHAQRTVLDRVVSAEPNKEGKR
jgi:hypothetical protein